MVVMERLKSKKCKIKLAVSLTCKTLETPEGTMT